jgi:hypothetical protein
MRNRGANGQFIKAEDDVGSEHRSIIRNILMMLKLLPYFLIFYFFYKIVGGTDILKKFLIETAMGQANCSCSCKGSI